MNNLSERGIKILASLGLILTTMIWGFAFVVMKNSVDITRRPTFWQSASLCPHCCLPSFSIKIC